MSDQRDANGNYTQAPDTIRTWTGKRVSPLDLRVEDIDIGDIAHALSLQCRYNGHSAGHLSVARHSLWVSATLWRWNRASMYDQVMFAKWGLLHDAAEAYLGDMVRPMKHHERMGFYLEAEEQAERAIATKFRLPYPMPQEVKDADTFVLTEHELPEGTGARYTYDGNARQDEHEFIDWFVRLERHLTGMEQIA